MNRRTLMCLVGTVVGILTLSVAAVTQNRDQPKVDSPPSLSADPSAHPVAVVDLVRVFNESAQIQDLNDMIKLKTDEVTKEAEQRRKIISDKQLELSAFKPGSEDYDVRRKDLVRLNLEANVWLKLSEEELERSKFDWTRLIYEKAIKASGEIAADRRYQAVLQKTEFKPFEIEPTVQSLRRVIKERTVVFHIPEIDITDSVIRRMDAAYKAAGGKKQLGLSPPAAP